MGTEQAYFVFPENMQPTFAEVRWLNTYVEMLNGVRWGWVPGSRQLVMETSGIQFEQLYGRDFGFSQLVDTWKDQGVRIVFRCPFAADPEALQAEQDLVDDAIEWPVDRAEWGESSIHRKRSEAREALARSSMETATTRDRAAIFVAFGGLVPWLLIAGMIVGTIAAGMHVAHVLQTSGVENRRDTIERVTNAVDAPKDDTDLSTQRRGGNAPESEQQRSMRAIATRHTSAVTLQSSELFAK